MAKRDDSQLAIDNVLLNDRKLDPDVREKLQYFGDKISVPKLVRQYMRLFWQVHNELRENLEQSISELSTVLLDVLSNANKYDRTLAVAALAIDSEGGLVDRVLVFEELVSHHKLLAERNRTIGDLTSRFVTTDSPRDHVFDLERMSDQDGK